MANIYKFLRRLPLPTSVRLRLHRYLLDYESRHEYDDESGHWQFEYQLLEEEEASFHSRQLLRRARALRIPAPPAFEGAKLSDDYVRSGLDGRRFYLSLKGERKILAAIREEEKYRSESWARRIPYITAISGLIGTVTGLVALLDKWGK